jgi:PAS domain S-box-containing protein
MMPQAEEPTNAGQIGYACNVMFRTAFIATSNISRTAFRGWDGRTLGIAAVYLASYVLLAWLSYVRPILPLGITPWNPQAGLTLAFLIFYGPRWIPVTVAAALLAQVIVHPIPTASPVIWASSLWIGVVYGALAAVLRRQQLSAPIHTAMDAAGMAVLSAAGTLLVAVGYVGLFAAAGELAAADALRSVRRYWIADLNGILMLTPLLIYGVHVRERLLALRRHGWEIVAQFSVIALLLTFILLLSAEEQLRFAYLLFVPIIWIALRWSWPGAMLAVFGIQIGRLVAAEAQILADRFTDLQFLMLTLSLTALLLGAVVAERAGVLRRVAAREAEQRKLLAMAPDAVLTVDTSGDIQLANAAAIRLFGESAGDSRALHLTKLLPGLRLDSVEGRATLDGRHEDGSGFPAEIAWTRLDPPANQGFLMIVRDVTERRRAEAQLRERDAALARAMRFAVAGELASSLAHELNQPITALVSYLRASEILAARPADGDELLQATLGKAAHEAMRAATVMRRLRDFYQSGSLKRETVHVPSLCKAVASAFQDRLQRMDTTLVVRLDPSVTTIESDSTQLEIVLHNLLANALDSVAQLPAPQRRVQLRGSCAAGMVTLCVEDSGPGIAQDVADKLFEPLVTSKPDGMGLGLAISRSLVRARGGDLSLAPSTELGGASFAVRLPVTMSADIYSV